jgi:outer membrane lipoprotein-sorting protein
MRWVLLLILLLGGCAPTPRQPWPALPTAAELLARLEAQAGTYRSFDAAARVGVTVGGKYLASQQFILLQRPDRLRLDALTGFGQLILQLASDGERVTALLNDSVPPKFLIGRASQANISRLTRIPLAVDDLIALLLYDPPLAPRTSSRVKQQFEAVHLVLEPFGKEELQELLFDRALRLIGCRYYRQGKLWLAVEYAKFAQDSGFPRLIKLELPGELTKITLKISELSLNPAIDPQKFRLQQPDNAIVEELP